MPGVFGDSMWLEQSVQGGKPEERKAEGDSGGGVELRSCLLFADEETEAWSHQVAGGKVRRSPAGLALMTQCSCHLKAEG